MAMSMRLNFILQIIGDVEMCKKGRSMLDFHFRDIPLALIWSLGLKEEGRTVRKFSQ